MDSRAKFESFISSPPHEKEISRFPEDGSSAWPGSYKNLIVDLAWDAWQASRQALEGEPVAYQYWWPESPRQVTVCKAKDLPSTHPDLIVVPLYTHLSGHCPSCGRSAVRKDCDEVLTPEIEEIREHCNRAMKMEKSNE